MGTFTDPEFGPAYTMPDGKVQAGFEFFDFHEYLKRLRWVFIDNNMRPGIWIHMTQTHFIPCLAFADIILDGEDRFLDWGRPEDFIVMWGLARFRYSSPKKWGLAQVWMNKIGNDKEKPVEMPHWEYRQVRSYHAALMVHDIFATGGWLADPEKAGCYVDDAQFIGYWEPNSPIKSEDPAFVASVYKLKDRTAVVVVNDSKETGVATLKLDAAGLRDGASLKDLVVRDADAYDPPAGEDITKVGKPEAPDVAAQKEKVDDVATQFEDMLDKEQKLEEEKKRVGFLYDDHNFQWEDGILKLRVRTHDYRLLVVTSKAGGARQE
jgi:hypothetical protein